MYKKKKSRKNVKKGGVNPPSTPSRRTNADGLWNTPSVPSGPIPDAEKEIIKLDLIGHVSEPSLDSVVKSENNPGKISKLAEKAVHGIDMEKLDDAFHDENKILNDFKVYLYELNINAKIEKNDELIFSENIIKNEINKELQQTLNNSDINFKLKYLLSAVLINTSENSGFKRKDASHIDFFDSSKENTGNSYNSHREIEYLMSRILEIFIIPFLRTQKDKKQLKKNILVQILMSEINSLLVKSDITVNLPGSRKRKFFGLLN